MKTENKDYITIHINTDFIVKFLVLILIASVIFAVAMAIYFGGYESGKIVGSSELINSAFETYEKYDTVNFASPNYDYKLVCQKELKLKWESGGMFEPATQGKFKIHSTE